MEDEERRARMSRRKHHFSTEAAKIRAELAYKHNQKLGRAGQTTSTSIALRGPAAARREIDDSLVDEAAAVDGQRPAVNAPAFPAPQPERSEREERRTASRTQPSGLAERPRRVPAARAAAERGAPRAADRPFSEK